MVDGNYRTRLGGLVQREATVVVWLDYCFPRVFLRALRQTFRRVFTGERVYAGNTESFARAFLSRDSILWWVIISWRKNRSQLEELQRRAAGSGPVFFVFRLPERSRNMAGARGSGGFLSLRPLGGFRVESRGLSVRALRWR